MRLCYFFGALIVSAALVLSGCTAQESPAQRHAEANTAAGKAGKAAHGVAVETGKAARVAGHALSRAAHDAHAGWQEAAREDNAKRKRR